MADILFGSQSVLMFKLYLHASVNANTHVLYKCLHAPGSRPGKLALNSMIVFYEHMHAVIG